MHIRELTLTNVCQFQERTFRFQPGFNLLVGENGAGKTTLLRSILAALGSSQQTGRRPAMVDEDIRLHSDGLHIRAELESRDGNSMGELSYSKRLFSRAQRTRAGVEPLVLFYASNEATCSSFVGRRVYGRFSPTISSDPRSSEEELYDSEKEAERTQEQGHRFGRSREIRSFILRVLQTFAPDINHFSWAFAPYECLILKPKSESMKALSAFSSLKRPLENAVMRRLEVISEQYYWPDRKRLLLNAQGFPIGRKRTKRVLPPLVEMLGSLDADKRMLEFLDACSIEIRLTPRIVIHKDAGVMQLSQLSDGERRLFSILADIARQLRVQTPQANLQALSGIVLIDEIDVHLHPKWQRRIVPSLEDLFPECQFIATTHSPFVIQSLSPGRLIRLLADQSDSPDYLGQSIEDIIEYVQGIEMPQRSKREEDMNRAAETYFKMLRQGKNAPAQKLEAAELEYRLACEPFTDESGLNALLKLEAIAARHK